MAIINFLLKQKNETNNNIRSVNKTVTENDEILETEWGNSSRNPNSKRKREIQNEPTSKKKKIVLTGDSMVNGISEKGLSVNHKVKIVNFAGGEKILEKLDDKKPDLIVHVGTNGITNNVNLLANEKSSKSSKELPKTRRKSRKP